MIKGFVKLVLLLVVAFIVFYNLFPEKVAEMGLDSERGRAKLVLHETVIAGFHIVYLDGGRGEPLLLIHGIGADKDNWTRAARWLTPHFRVIALDLPGFGDSSKPANAHYRIEDQVENVHAFVQKLGLHDLSLGGSSMGGDIAASYAARYPGTVKTLWLLDPGGVSTAPPSEMMQRIAKGERVPIFASTPEEFDQVLDFVFTKRPFIPGAIKDELARRAVANYALDLKILKQIATSPPLEKVLANDAVKVPTRIVWGEQDRVLNPASAKILAALLPDSSVLMVPGVGHLPMLEQPKAVALDYLAWRESLYQQPSAAAH
ncbi:MAG: alpha/beta fold hydrolase [Stenotrophobium sp.]